MRTKKPLICLVSALAAVLCFSGRAQAQDYNYAVGIRASYYPALTFKYNFKPGSGLEAIAAFQEDGFNFNALYERNVPVIGNGFNFYYGAGANIGSWEKHDRSKFCMGVDGIVGLEYKIPTAPIAFSIDYKPELNFIGHTGFVWKDFAFNVRFTF